MSRRRASRRRLTCTSRALGLHVLLESEQAAELEQEDTRQRELRDPIRVQARDEERDARVTGLAEEGQGDGLHEEDRQSAEKAASHPENAASSETSDTDQAHEGV